MVLVTIEDEWELVCDLSSVAIFNDLEWPIIKISRKRHYSTLNIPETVQDRHGNNGLY